MHNGKNKGKKWEDQASQDADKLASMGGLRERERKKKINEKKQQ